MDKTIVCRLTAALPSAIATVAVRGPQVHRKLASIIGCNDNEEIWSLNRIRLLPWPITSTTTEQVVVCRVATDEVEVHCHGGVAVSSAILNSLAKAGCEIVDWSGWNSSRAPGDLKQQIDQLCTEALIQTRSERAAGILLDQLNGALLTALSQLHSQIAERNWQQPAELIARLMRWNELGLHLTKPWRVVLAGPPNVGKSSLINTLAGQTVSIVHAEAGTTRDWTEAETMIDGWHVVLTDTAGVRETDNTIEKQGVQRARQQMSLADLVILVVDSTLGWKTEHDAILKSLQQQRPAVKLIVAWNKCDLQTESSSVPPTGLPVIRCSRQHSLDELLTAISQSLVPQAPPEGEAVIFEPNMQVLLAQIARVLSTEMNPSAESEVMLLTGQLVDARRIL